MSGSNVSDYNRIGFCGKQGEFSPYHTPSAGIVTGSVDSSTRELWLFGGYMDDDGMWTTYKPLVFVCHISMC